MLNKQHAQLSQINRFPVGPLPAQQRGAVLIVSLIILLVLAFLAVQGTQTSTLEEKMAGNFRTKKAAFEGAEAALLAAEEWLQAQAVPPVAGSDGQSTVWSLGNSPADTPSTWDTNKPGVHILADANLYGFDTPPTYVIEERRRVSGAGGGAETGTITQSTANSDTYSYRITAAGAGANANSIVVLQSHYERTF